MLVSVTPRGFQMTHVENGEELAHMEVEPHKHAPAEWFVSGVIVEAGHRRRGIARALYDDAQRIVRETGGVLVPSSRLSDDSFELWLDRNPRELERILARAIDQPDKFGPAGPRFPVQTQLQRVRGYLAEREACRLPLI